MTNVEELGRELTALLPADQVLALGQRLLGQERIAVVSAACRFPRGVSDLDTYWELTVSGRDAVTEVPPSRWAVEPWFDPDPKTPDRTYSRWGAFLDDVAGFEPRFFGIAPKDAGRMDPQQRLLLELSGEALERAGLDLRALSSSRTGVFVGAFTQDWFDLQHGGRPHCDPSASLGSQFGLLAAQISYWLNLHGPAMVIETACSSSLVALHVAAQSLRQGECDTALVGGVQLFLTPRQQIMCSRLRMLSPRGHCHVFDEHADGIVLGEGAGMLVLKRLSDALRGGDPIVAVLRGSAINHDGRTLGVSAPNPEAQRRVLAATVDAASVEAADVGYIEAHGTGTAIGDPAELESIQSVYGDGRRPCYVGSSKATFGHTVAASGIASLCRALGVLHRAIVPPQLHLTTLNRRFALADTRFRITTEVTPHAAELVAVSNFGNSGTNAHAILERPPSRGAPRRPRDRAWIYMVSAPDEASQLASLKQHAAYAEAATNTIEDLSWTSCFRRTKHRIKTAIVARSRQELVSRLQDAASGRAWICADHPPPLVWIFPDSTRPVAPGTMAALYSLPGIEAALDGVARLFRQELGVDLSREGKLDARLSGYALQVGLAHILGSWGCSPDVIVGDGLGELAAACVAARGDAVEGARAVVALVRDQASTRAVDLHEGAPGAGSGRVLLSSRSRDERTFDASLRDFVASFDETPLVLDLAPEGAMVERLCRAAKAVGRKVTVLDPGSELAFMDRLWALAAGLQAHGVPLLASSLGYDDPLVLALPTHPWQREVYWTVPRLEPGAAKAEMAPLALLQQHRLGAGAVVPGAALLESLFRGPGVVVVEDIRFDALLRIPEGASSLPTWELRHDGERVEVWSEGVCHLSARRRTAAPWQPGDVESLDIARGRCTHAVEPAELYAKWRSHGVDYGPAFRAVQSVRLGVDELVAELEIPHDIAHPYATTMLHPVTLDAALHVAALLLPEFGAGEPLLPRGIDTIAVRGTVPLRVVVHARRSGDHFDVVVWALEGEALAVVSGLSVGATAPPIRVLVPDWQTLTAHPQKQASTWACPGRAGDLLRPHLVRGGIQVVDRAPQVMIGLPESAGRHVAAYFGELFDEVGNALAGGAERILFVTRGAAMSPVVEPLAASAWGAANALALEFPTVRWACLDVERLSDLEYWAQIELPAAEDRVALRHDEVFGLRWRQAPLGHPRLDLSALDVVLVSGGTGGVGAQLCHALREAGVAQVIALSRRPASVGEAGIEHLQVDLDDPAAVEAVIRAIRVRGRRIEGVVHCAGAVISKAFEAHDAATLETVTAAKVRGAMHLFASTRTDALRFFALVSSVSGAFGSEGQAGYAAANAALDAFAESLHNRGVPAVSCAFGPWSKTGALRERPDVEARLSRLGVPAMDPRAVSRAFLAALGGPSPRIVLSSLDLPRWFSSYEGERTRACWTDLQEHGPSAVPAPCRVTRPRIEAAVRDALTAILALKSSDLEAPRSLLDLGMTSLGALDLRDRLEMEIGVRLPSTSLWSQPSMHAVVDLVEAELERLSPAPSIDFPEMGDDAVDQALLDEISALGL